MYPSWLHFFGGFAFFFYGLITFSSEIKLHAGERLKYMIAKSTQSRLLSFLTGVVVTFFFQSSAAVNLMSVNLATQGLLTVRQTMAVSLGAGLGATLVVLLISIKSITSYGLLFIILGLLLNKKSGQKRFQVWGTFLFGFGLIFYGLTEMTEATRPLMEWPMLKEIFSYSLSKPWITMISVALATTLLHSSSLIFAILISLTATGAFDLHQALPIMLGANLGTSFTSVTASWRAEVLGRRVAWAQFILRILAVLVLLPVTVAWGQKLQPLLETSFRWFHSEYDLGHLIAVTHFLFNALLAFTFLPLIPWGEKLAEWVIKASPHSSQPFGPKYLDEQSLETPALAFAQAQRELTRMGEFVAKMLTKSFALFDRFDMDLHADIRELDDCVDKLYAAIKFYLARLSGKILNEKEQGLSVAMVSAVHEFENMGDMIEKQVCRHAEKMANRQMSFSAEGFADLKELHQGSCEMMKMALASMVSSDDQLVHKLLRLKEKLEARADEINRAHLERLRQNRKESVETSTAHLELVAIFKRINTSVAKMIEDLFMTHSPFE
jgi:phosphate:Na+ symporter